MSEESQIEINEGNQTFNEDIEESHDPETHQQDTKEQEQRDEEQEIDQQSSQLSQQSLPKQAGHAVKRGRGRPPIKEKRRGGMINISNEPFLKLKYNLDEIPIDETGKLVELVNDEYVLNPDPEGDLKVSAFGVLKDNKQYSVKTFTLPDRNHGKTLYVLGSDMARHLKYKDAYVFFLNYKTTLYKAFLTDTEKEYLLEKGLLKQGIKTRTISITTARSCFREFGYKVVKNGRPGIDDYYVTTEAYPPSNSPVSPQEVARKFINSTRGSHPVVAATPVTALKGRASTSSPSLGNRVGLQSASPSATPSMNATANSAIKQRSHSSTPFHVNSNAKRTVEFFNMMNSNMNISLNDKINKENWIFMHAQSCSSYNEDVFYEREKNQFIDNSGIRDPYTNTLHVPTFTQPTKVLKKSLTPLTESDKKKMLKRNIIYETRIKDDDLRNMKTGLSDLPLHLFKDLVDQETLSEIEKQVQYESNN